MSELPSGTVTFLFTDIEGSTALWERYPDAMRRALDRHDALLRATITARDGVIFKTIGDACCAAFATASDAVAAALDAQTALHSEPWETPLTIRVRMAIHTGAVESRDNDFFGPPLNRVARLLAVGHGGQILISRTTYDLACDPLPPNVGIKSLGEHRLKDLARPEHVFQLLSPDLPSEFPELRSLDNPGLRHNLPIQVTSFIGREAEMNEIKAILHRTRLLTLAGSGGSGKTRLSLQVAADLLDEYRDGVWFVELAPLTDPGLVPQALASVLGIREAPGQPILQTVLSVLKPKRTLLILDNCEHLLAAVTRLVDALLRTCPEVRILLSSREALGISGEAIYRVPNLSVPPLPTVKFAVARAEAKGITASNLMQYEAVRLFVERAMAVLPHFVVTNENAPALASVCHRLDGIPLAIELASARIRSLSLDDLNTRLDQRFRLLTGGSRTALPRQQTLRAMIDWSYSLLNAREGLLLQRLAVFAGGWTLEAAEAVCVGERANGDLIENWEVLDLMTGLVDKSLVMVEERDGTTRYRLLETVRQYSREKLAESGETPTVQARHRDYFLTLSEIAGPQLHGPQQVDWYERLQTEHDNLRAALDWSLHGGTAHPGASSSLEVTQSEAPLSEAPQSDVTLLEETMKGMRMIEALKLFWCLRGYFEEGQYWVNESLGRGQAAPDALVAQVLNTGGVIAWFQADFALLDRHCTRALELAVRANDKWCQAAALILLGSGAAHEHDHARAEDLLARARLLAREVGNAWLISQSLHHSAVNAMHQGDLDRTAEFASEALQVATGARDKWVIALATRVLGFVALARKDYAGAVTALKRASHLYLELRYKWGIATNLEGLARLSQRTGEYQRAARLFGIADMLRESTGAPLPALERPAYERDVEALRDHLGAETDVLWAEGRSMSLDQAVAFALEQAPQGAISH